MLMKGLVTIGVAVALAAVTPDLWASSAAAGPSAGQPSLLLVGPVESISEKNGTAVVLGQKLSVALPESVVVGDSVSVYGKMRDDGTLAISKVTNQGIYVPGATHVVLTALVQQVHASVGRAKVGGLDVDLTSIGTTSASTSVVSGTVVQISGTQPSTHGVVLADAIVGGGFSSNAIVGGGLNAIVGGGSQSDAIVGGGLNAIVGGGSKPNAIVGGGLNAIVGGGSKPNAIVGGGLNAIVGGGSKPNAIVGGGLNAIVGGGSKPNAIVGGGLNAIVGGGSKPNAIVGGGLN
jgi:hypothetical protein